jgi:hypothetical protein
MFHRVRRCLESSWVACLPVIFPALAAGSPLAEAPSADGPHVAQIRAMQAGNWLELGPPSPDPQWGSARGRTWSAKMPAAAESGGAFLFGEGVHGWWNKETGRYMDDLWFYDLRAHRWVCLHPGTKVPGDELTLNSDGFETGADGHPVPVASMVHGYGQVTYDPKRRQFLAMPCPGDYWKQALSARAGKGALPNESHASPWIYDLVEGHWKRFRTAEEGPRSGFGDSLVYLPSQDKVWFRHHGSGGQQVALYDPEAKAWQPVVTSGPPPPFGIDASECHDTKRDRIYLAGGKYPVAEGNAFWVYEVANSSWSDPQPEGAPGPAGVSYGTNEALMHYDQAKDKVVLIRHHRSEWGGGVHAYDPAANRWQAVATRIPDFGGREAVSGFYDARLEVHVVFAAGDSAEDGSIWIYRH